MKFFFFLAILVVVSAGTTEVNAVQKDNRNLETTTSSSSSTSTSSSSNTTSTTGSGGATSTTSSRNTTSSGGDTNTTSDSDSNITTADNGETTFFYPSAKEAADDQLTVMAQRFRMTIKFEQGNIAGVQNQLDKIVETYNVKMKDDLEERRLEAATITDFEEIISDETGSDGRKLYSYSLYNTGGIFTATCSRCSSLVNFGKDINYRRNLRGDGTRKMEEDTSAVPTVQELIELALGPDAVVSTTGLDLSTTASVKIMTINAGLHKKFFHQMKVNFEAQLALAISTGSQVEIDRIQAELDQTDAILLQAWHKFSVLDQAESNLLKLEDEDERELMAAEQDPMSAAEKWATKSNAIKAKLTELN